MACTLLLHLPWLQTFIILCDTRCKIALREPHLVSNFHSDELKELMNLEDLRSLEIGTGDGTLENNHPQLCTSLKPPY